ncbi:hypothetical protein RchiOBHm_Chr3g0468441 [Rosa chinensis]|uniref:Uncharacterized protein n=1 Tax=Rosa chinensis TaxID=74649 RepID=A0A2P6RAJ1_ROSCH|nr:hypothetical protein RchiOBHm_Chr3g0468441 [Rosa chinensis]
MQFEQEGVLKLLLYCIYDAALLAKTWKKVRFQELKGRRHQCTSEAFAESSVATFLLRHSRLPAFEANRTTNLENSVAILAMILPLFGGSLSLIVFEGLDFAIDTAIALDFSS